MPATRPRNTDLERERSQSRARNPYGSEPFSYRLQAPRPANDRAVALRAKAGRES